MRERSAFGVVVLAIAATSACTHGSTPAPGGPASTPSTHAVAAGPSASAPVVPVPETLAFVAGQFGLTMQPDGFTWKVLRRNVTRFDWSGRSHDAAGGEREVLYSFFFDKLDDATFAHLPEIAASAAANLTTDGETCKPIEQPSRIVHELGVDRIVSVCFEPSPFYGGKEQHRNAVLHAIVHGGALTVVAVLANESAAMLPSPVVIGSRGTR
jgi:hypothetical protein